MIYVITQDQNNIYRFQYQNIISMSSQHKQFYQAYNSKDNSDQEQTISISLSFNEISCNGILVQKQCNYPQSKQMLNPFQQNMMQTTFCIKASIEQKYSHKKDRGISENTEENLLNTTKFKELANIAQQRIFGIYSQQKINNLFEGFEDKPTVQTFPTLDKEDQRNISVINLRRENKRLRKKKRDTERQLNDLSFIMEEAYQTLEELTQKIYDLLSENKFMKYLNKSLMEQQDENVEKRADEFMLFQELKVKWKKQKNCALANKKQRNIKQILKYTQRPSNC